MIFAWVPMALAGELALQIDTRELVVGQAVPVKLQVINGRPSGVPELPVGPGLLAQYQGQSQKHVIVNFDSTRIVEYSYQLAATSEGTWQVGPVNLVVDGAPLSAPAITVEVGAPPVEQGGKPILASVTDDTPVLGQVIVYRFQFKHDKPVVNARWGRPEFPGMVEEVNAEVAQREYQMVQDGRPYTVQTIDVPLVAAGVGMHTIEPASLTAQFRTERKRRRGRSIDDMFGGTPFGLRGNTETRSFSTDPVSIEVSALPLAARPPSFSGLVGTFQVRIRPSESVVKLGESTTLEMVIVGDGTLAGFTFPAAPEDAGFRVYDDTPEIKAKVLDGRFRSSMTVRRAVVPEETGDLTIPSIELVTYDPNQESYVTIRTQPVQLKVLPGEEGAGEVASFADQGVDRREAVDSLEEDILPVSVDGPITDRTLMGSLPVLLSIPSVSALSWLLISLVSVFKRRTIDPRTALRRRLRTLPSDELERLAELEDVFRELAGLRLGIPAPGLSADRVATLGQEAAELYRDLDRVRYGGGSARDLEDRIRRFMEGT